jgi:uncharacterized alpha-E superfamily protein
MAALLSRYAECLFWMARYVERAENQARLLDVTETFTRDQAGGQNWQSVVSLNADEERFFKQHGAATAESVVSFYLFDGDNPTSVFSAVRGARENARSLRPLISTEMWTELNIFYNRVMQLQQQPLALARLSQICREIKEDCQTFTGIAEGTFYRGEGWCFHELGRYLERADQATRLLDIKYHVLLPSSAEVGSAVDAGQWNALLRSAAGYHAFRQEHPSGMSPTLVADFLLFNDRFPRSVRLCVLQVHDLLHLLRTRHGLRGGVEASERLDEMLAAFNEYDIDRVIKEGLHEYLDYVQRQLISITSSLARDFFGQAEAA